jgi:hypothetical protein
VAVAPKEKNRRSNKEMFNKGVRSTYYLNMHIWKYKSNFI